MVAATGCGGAGDELPGYTCLVPYRNVRTTELCSLCRAPADNQCVRCGRWMCETHGTERDDERCSDCEMQYQNALVEDGVLTSTSLSQQQPMPLHELLWMVAGWVVLVPIALAVLGELTAFNLLLGVGCCLLSVPFLLLRGRLPSLAAWSQRSREANRRRAFLAERKFPELTDGS